MLFSKTSLRVLSRTGMKFANALMLTSLLLSNSTGVVQAGNLQAQPKQPQNIIASIGSVEKAYHAPVFSHPESRMADKNTSPAQAGLPSPILISATPIGNWKFDEGAGLIAIDAGSPAHNGTINGTPAWVNGRYYDPISQSLDYALQFNGTNAYVSVPDTFNPTAYTIAMWVKPSAINRNLFARTNSSGPTVSASHDIYINSSGFFCAYTYDGVGKTVCGTTKVNTTTPTWYHVASTAANSGQLKLYVNGVQEGTPLNLNTLWTGGDRYYIGSNLAGGLGYFSGAMDEVLLYSSALPAIDIRELYYPDQSVIDISMNPVVADNTSAANIQVTLKDGNGNLLANHTLSMNVSGSGNTISPTTIQTDANGLASFTLKSTKAETKTITVFDQTQAIILDSKPTITFVPGPASPQKSTVATDLTGVTNNGIARATITVTAMDAYNNLVPGATVDVNANGSAVVAQSNTITDSLGRLIAYITDTAPELVTVSAIINSTQIPQTVNVRFHCRTNGDLVIPTGDACSFAAGTYTYNNITVQAGGTLILQGNAGTNQGVVLNAVSITVDLGGKISADGYGYPSASGPGAGHDGTGPRPSTGGGAGYGGVGQAKTGLGGDSYGSMSVPMGLGSGGGRGFGTVFARQGGPGGGAIKLQASDKVIVNGVISVNGMSGEDRAGGGSGGSILIISSSLEGSGSIIAKGGSGVNGGGAGAGGRIAVYADEQDHTITFSVAGAPGYEVAGQGTIYLDSLDQLNSTIEITPAQPNANGTDIATLRVTLLNVDGVPMPNKPVDIAIASGSNLTINGTQVSANQYITIGNTNSNGVATTSITTTIAGTRTIKARSGQELIVQEGTVEFVPGAVSATTSLITASPASAPADGQSPITVTVTARDSNNNLIQGANVVLQSTGNAVVTQPTTPTDSQGKTSGQIVNASGETVTISAKVNGVDLQDVANIVFRAADMQLLLTAPSVQSVGTNIQYQVDVRNISSIVVQNASLQVNLPAGIAYVNSNASVSPSENGQALTWNLGNFAPGASTVFTIFGSLTSSIPAGTLLEIQGVLTSATPEESLANNSAIANTQVVDGRSFTVSLSPASKTIGANATAAYQISIDNTGLLADNYNLTVSGLDPSWFVLSEAAFNLAPGEVKSIDLSLQASGCTLTGSIPFSVNTISSNQTITKSAQLIAQSGPVVTNIYPENNTSLGSRDITFSWKSDSLSTGTLHIFPVGQPAQDVTYSTPSSTSHSRIVTGLTRNVTYAWFVESASECGVTTTPTRQFTVSNGVVFKSHDQSYTINRDYDQTIMVPVINQDSVSHTIHLEIVPHPYADLTVNFRGSGSIDQDITLLPGETRSVQLAFFAQDAQLNNYVITARLTSEDGGETISDLATIRTRVLFEANYTIEAVHVDPVLNVTTYRVKNSNFGQPITDLTISAIDHSTGLPANVLLVPQIYHARLGTGESLEFQAIPQYSVDQVANFNNLGAPSGVLAAPKKYRVSTVSFDLVSKVKDLVQVLPVQQQCDGNVYAVTFDGPRAIALPFYTWYCPNRPNILIELMLSLFMGNSEILDSLLQLSFSPAATAEAHDMTVSINGHEVGGTTNAVPDGTYSFNIDSSFINPSSNSGAKQQININANFDNFAHYQIGSNGKLFIAMDGLTLFICADSLEEAQDIAQQLYGFTKPPEYVNVLIEQPATIGTVALDENGLVNIRAQVMDDLVPYVNLYSVVAEVEYLDQPGTPSEQFLIFDDGETGHGDAAANDRHFNAKWLPKYGGEVRLTVSATALGGLSAEASKTFFVNAQPDFEVNNVFIEKIAREGDAVEVQAEVANNGFTVTGPVLVEFRYYNATDEGLKIGNPIYTSQQELFGTILNNTFDHGETLTIKDNTFVAPAVHLYYVEVVIDPQTQP